MRSLYKNYIDVEKIRPLVKNIYRDYYGYISVELGGHESDFDFINSLVNLSTKSTNKKTKNELYRSNKKEIKRVIFNEPYTIVIWANGEKTIVKAQDGEPYDKEKGLAMCFAKYALGNTCRYFDFFKEVCDEAD